MNWQTTKEAVKKFLGTIYYTIIFLIVGAVVIALIIAVNWGMSWAGCWLLFRQYPPPSRVNSFDIYPDHVQFMMPYIGGWAIILIIWICFVAVVSLYKRYLTKKKPIEES